MKACKNCPWGTGLPTKVSVKYPSDLGGYTPGDTWELYVGKDNRVEYLVFHHGGDKKPSVVNATWAGYKKAGPLLISTEHRGTADGKPLHIFISNRGGQADRLGYLDERNGPQNNFKGGTYEADRFLAGCSCNGGRRCRLLGPRFWACR